MKIAFSTISRRVISLKSLFHVKQTIHNINDIINAFIWNICLVLRPLHLKMSSCFLSFICVGFRRRHRIKIFTEWKNILVQSPTRPLHYKTLVGLNWFLSGALPSTIKFTFKINYTFKDLIWRDCLGINKFYMCGSSLFISVCFIFIIKSLDV